MEEGWGEGGIEIVSVSLLKYREGNNRRVKGRQAWKRGNRWKWKLRNPGSDDNNRKQIMAFKCKVKLLCFAVSISRDEWRRD